MDRMTPARQRLHADDAAIGGVYDRLIMDRQLALLDRLAKILRQQGAFAVLTLHFLVEALGAIASAVLGGVEREIGSTHDARKVALPRLDQVDADAEAERDQPPADVDRLLNGRDQALRQASRGVRVE